MAGSSLSYPLHLVQILLPLFDNEGEAIPQLHFRRVAEELADRFGGLTAFTRAPAEGRWKDAASGPAMTRSWSLK